MRVAAILLFREADGIGEWLDSPGQPEAFGPLAITTLLFVGPANVNQAGLIVEVPDMEAFQRFLGSGGEAGVISTDGVRQPG